MRCFVAVEISDDLKSGIISLQKSLPEIDAKLVEEENLHFTLKFLGEIDDKNLSESTKILSNTVKEFRPFSAVIRGAGAFPNINYARVLWLGCPELYNLQKAVDDSLSLLFKKEREINPHLTIARIRSARSKQELMDFINKNKNIEIGSFVVKEIKLKKSILTQKGPIYEDIEVFRLG